MGIILHIAERAAWVAAAPHGEYAPASLLREGFIHCSTASQAAETANSFFRGRQDLVLVCIEEGKTRAEVRYEPPGGGRARSPILGAEFPHLYGPLALDAVVRVVDFPPCADGTFTLPREIASLISQR